MGYKLFHAYLQTWPCEDQCWPAATYWCDSCLQTAISFPRGRSPSIAPRVLDTVQDLKSFPAPQHADYPLYYLGLVLAVAGCVSGGAMNVLVARFIFTLINQYC